MSKKEMTNREKAALAAKFADNRKAENIVLLDVSEICTFTDIFLICTANNRVQLNAINDAISDGFRELGLKYPPDKGNASSTWLVFDAGDVVAHIMTEDSRKLYRLENLWGDGKQLNWEQLLNEMKDGAG